MTESCKFGGWVESYRNGFGVRPAPSEVGPIVLRIADVSSGIIDLSSPRRGAVSEDQASTYRLRRGDLLFIRVNGAREIVGRCCVVGSDVPTDTIFNDHLIRVRLKPGVDPEFARLCVGLPAARTAIEKAAATSAGQLTIGQSVLDGIAVPNFEIEEQRQIAARLKAQLAEVEAARQAVQAQLRDAAMLRRAVLKANFDALLSRYTRCVSLKDVCGVSAGGTPSRGNSSFFGGHIPWVKTLDLNFGLVVDTEEKISQAAFDAIRGELLPIGTVMVAMYGGVGTIGKSGILGIEACTNQAVCALKPNIEELDAEFLHLWLSYIRPEWIRLAGGNRKDPNINKAIVENMTLPLPPIQQQRCTVTRLKTQLAEADALRAALEQQQRELNALPQRILAQAFDPHGVSP